MPVYLFTDFLVDFREVIVNSLSAFCVSSLLQFQLVPLRLKPFTIAIQCFLHKRPALIQSNNNLTTACLCRSNMSWTNYIFYLNTVWLHTALNLCSPLLP